MTDLALFWDDETFSADVALVAGDLAADDGLRTAVILSIFTDRRARPDDPLPQDGVDRRGWWADLAAVDDDDLIGSRLWLLSREKIVPETLARAREYVVECLGWMLRDQVASAVEVIVETAGSALAIGIFITRPGGPDRQRFDFVWKATT